MNGLEAYDRILPVPPDEETWSLGALKHRFGPRIPTDLAEVHQQVAALYDRLNGIILGEWSTTRDRDLAAARGVLWLCGMRSGMRDPSAAGRLFAAEMNNPQCVEQMSVYDTTVEGVPCRVLWGGCLYGPTWDRPVPEAYEAWLLPVDGRQPWFANRPIQLSFYSSPLTIAVAVRDALPASPEIRNVIMGRAELVPFGAAVAWQKNLGFLEA